MDNLTHSLIGLVAGEVAARALPARSSTLPADTRRGILLCMGVVGSNLPDIDLLWSMSTGDQLGYLLEHRGYTHTVLGCLLLATLLYGGAWLWLRIRSLSASAQDRLTLGITACASVLLHLSMDALNVYGVHPFWPWNNRWFYGDAVFIIEPLYWLAAAPLLFVLRTTTARVVLALILLVAGIAVLAVHRFGLLWWSAPLLAGLLVMLGRRCSARAAALTSATLMLVIAAVFMTGRQVAASRIDALAHQHFPGVVTLDKVLSPNPTNPFCWDVLLVQSGNDSYVVRRGLLSIARPPLAASCSRLLAGRGTAPLTPVSAAESPEMLWLGEFAATRSSLTSLVANDCAARELMQFVRAPFATEVDGHWVIGDLRFDREAGVGMAELAIDPGRPRSCRYKVPWIPPRADLLDPAAGE